MSRQQDVVQALFDGFGWERTSGVRNGEVGPVQVIIDGIEGYFEIDAAGDVTKWPVGLGGELRYWVSIDLGCLDILAADEIMQRLEP